MVQSDVSSIIYVGNNSTTAPYPAPFYFFHDEDLLVTSIDSLGTEAVLQLNTDYIVTGAGNQNGGSIKTTFAVPTNWHLRIERVLEPTQLTSYQEGDAFPALSHERALDKLTMLVQQALRDAGGGASGGGKAWANDAERQLTTPGFTGQLGFQVNTATIYYATSTTTGAWKKAIFDNLSAVPGQLPIFSSDAHLANIVIDGIATLTGGVLGATAKPAGDLVGTTQPQTLENKTLNAPVLNTPTGLTKLNVGLGNVDNTSDLNKPVSNATTASLSQKEDKINKGQLGGYADLDSTGKVPLNQLPASILGANVYQGTWNAATNTPTIPAASLANQGFYRVVSVAGSTNIDGTSTWALGDWIISNGTIWERIINIDAVSSVNAKTGAVVINKADVGLSNVDNTSDATKNTAAATLTNKTLTAPVINSPTGLVKGDVGLSAVDNTSDAQKNAAAVTLTNKTIDGANNTLRVRLDTTDVVNNLPVSHFNGGSGASATTFWRGDGQWITPPGSGDVTGPAGAVAGELATYANSTGKLLGRTTLPANMVLADSTQGSNPATSIIIPSYINHPDRIITSPSAFDDHFDGTTLNAKWVMTDTPASSSVSHAVAGSCLSIHGVSENTTNNTKYTRFFKQPIPNASDFTITMKVEMSLVPCNLTGSASYFYFDLFGGTGGSLAGVRIVASSSFLTGVGASAGLDVFGGFTLNQSYQSHYSNTIPKYLRFIYFSSSKNCEVYISNNGFTFRKWVTVPTGYSNFATNPPANVQFGIANSNAGMNIADIDWIKFTNP